MREERRKGDRQEMEPKKRRIILFEK